MLPADCRFVPKLPALVMEADLVSSFWAPPIQVARSSLAGIEQPCPFSSEMAIRRLPNLANPHRPIRACTLPSNSLRPGKTVGAPCVTKSGMFQHATKVENGGQSRSEATIVIAGSIVLAAPSGEIHMSKTRPKLTWRVTNNRMRTCIFPGVTLRIPRVYVRQPEITPIGFDKEGRDQYLNPLGVNRISMHRRMPDSRVVMVLFPQRRGIQNHN